jgi:DNA topoisomerase-6 subunit A
LKNSKSVFDTGNNVDVIAILEKVVLQIMDDLEAAKKPVITSTKESVDNAIYDQKLGILVPGDKKNSIQLDVSSIKKMTRMLFVARILINNLKSGAVNSLREIYYISKGFFKSNPGLKPLDFDDQSECDSVVAELCGMVEAYREDFNVVANEKSGLTYSKSLMITETLPNGKKVTLDLGNMGTAPYIPKNKPQDLKLSIKKGHKIDFILAIESEGTANTFVSNGFLERNDAIIIALGGQPANSVRGFLHLIQEQLDIPIYVFTDLDAFSVNILRSLKAGSYNSLLRSKQYTAPDARFLGILPSDIKKYDLNCYEVNDKDPTENRALKRASDLLKTDPFFKDKRNKKYRDVLDFLLSSRLRCEQQALFSVYPKDPTGPEKIILDKIKNGDYI